MSHWLRCFRLGLLLERRSASGLDEAERLMLEDHLSGCTRCQEEARVLHAVAVVVERCEKTTLSVQSRERALQRAFKIAAQEVNKRHMPGAPRISRWALAAVSLPLVAALLVLAFRFRHVKPADPQVADVVSEIDRVERGTVTVAGRALTTGEAVVPSQVVHTDSGARVILSQARVDLGPTTDVVWDPGASQLDLRSGVVHVSLDPTLGRHFRVRTERFAVEVLGTEFEVDLQGVRVDRGTVRVLPSAGEAILEALHAGDSWSVGPTPSASARTVAQSTTTPDIVHNEHGPRPSLLSARDGLARARSALAQGRVAEARSAVSGVLHLDVRPEEKAEARSLLAECEVFSGNIEEGIRLYLAVAEDFAARPAGENALFAAARLSLNQGTRERARQLLERYLDRYPKGHFCDEARRHLNGVSHP
jgi:FecR protein